MDTITSSADVTRVFKEGKRFGRGSSALLVLKRTRQHGLQGRVAFVAGKKLGNAVWRNRAKRRMRAACQRLHGPWQGYDIVFIANKYTTEVEFEKLVADYGRTLSRIGMEAE